MTHEDPNRQQFARVYPRPPRTVKTDGAPKAQPPDARALGLASQHAALPFAPSDYSPEGSDDER
jgi:hypothetical protein